MYVVECFFDEAGRVVMASKTPIFVEEEVYVQAGSIPVRLDVENATVVKHENGGEDNSVKDMELLSFGNRVPHFARWVNPNFLLNWKVKRYPRKRNPILYVFR